MARLIESGEFNKKFPVGYGPKSVKSPHVALGTAGQDIREPGMFDQIMKFPAGEETIREGADFLKKEFGFDLIKIADKDADPKVLRETRYTQPAVGLWSMGFQNVHRYHGEKSEPGHTTVAGDYFGTSMGKVTAGGFAGFMSPTETLLFLGNRGEIMQRYSDPTPSSMISIPDSEANILKLLGQEKYKDLDWCLTLAEGLFVIGGPDSEDPKNPDSSAPMQQLRAELNEQKKKFGEVTTDRAMHGRGVRPARPYFDAYVNSRNFRDPIAGYVGSVTGLRVRTEEGMKDELKHTFDHTDDNTRALKFLDAQGAQIIYEIHPRGNTVNTLRRGYNAIIPRGEAILSHAGLKVQRVFTRHHPDNPNKELT